MKSIMFFLFSMLAATVADAQSRLCSRITDMLGDVSRQIADTQQQLGSKRTLLTQVCPVDTAAIQKKMVVSFHADGKVRTVDVVATLADGATCPSSDLEARGIKVKDVVRRFVFLTVPVEQLEYLETLREFVSLDENTVYHAMTNNARKVVNVSNINGIDSVAYTFDMPYTGKGVVVGIVDSGIDYNHVAFKDGNGDTRVKKVVHYTYASNDATVVTAPEEIAALETDGSYHKDKSHGTNVAGCAAGSIVDATIDYEPGVRRIGGMAPEADLVLCGVYTLTHSHIARSVEEIVKTAQELNEPCVINFSFGTVGDWHDGSYNVNKLVHEYEKEGVIFCISSGNSAGYSWNVDKVIPADGDMKFIIRKNKAVASVSMAYIPDQYIKIFVPHCTDPGALSCSFEVVDSITGEVTTLSQTALRDIDDNIVIPDVQFVNDEAHQNWVKTKFHLAKSYFEDNSKFLVVKLHNNTGSDLRAYVMSSLVTGDSYQNSYACTDFPNYEYDKGTSDVSHNDACSADNFISVGAYSIWPGIVSYDGTQMVLKPGSAFYLISGPPNSTAGYSSYGRDDYGKVHPDVIAPATFIVTAYNRYDFERGFVTDKSSWVKQYICAYYVDSNNDTHLFCRSQGTSMTVAVVSGIVALWLQAYPKLDAKKVREILAKTSCTSVNGEDINVTSGNNIQLGYGLIDAEAGMRYLLDTLIPSCIDGISTTEQAEEAKATKKLCNGKIIIEKNGIRYNTVGQITR